jgi:hypothetical protein
MTAIIKAARVAMILSDILVQYTGMRLGPQMR